MKEVDKTPSRRPTVLAVILIQRERATLFLGARVSARPEGIAALGRRENAAIVRIRTERVIMHLGVRGHDHGFRWCRRADRHFAARHSTRLRLARRHGRCSSPFLGAGPPAYGAVGAQPEARATRDVRLVGERCAATESHGPEQDGNAQEAHDGWGDGGWACWLRVRG